MCEVPHSSCAFRQHEPSDTYERYFFNPPIIPPTVVSQATGRRGYSSRRSMSALGHKQTYAAHKLMSALPPIATARADIGNPSCLLYPRKRTCAVHLGMSAL